MEFKTLFFKLVRSGQAEVKEKQKKAALRVKRRMDKLAKEHQDRHCKPRGAKIDTNFKEKHKVQALRKVAKVSEEEGWFGWLHGGEPCLCVLALCSLGSPPPHLHAPQAASVFEFGQRDNPLKVFEGTLDPTSFRDQLFNVFRIRLTPPQLGAILSHFDADGDGTIDGTEFKLEFCRISEAAKKAMKQANEQQAEKVRTHYNALQERSLAKFNKVPQGEME